MSDNLKLNTTKKRQKKIFIAKFQRYIPLFDGDKRLHFFDIEDDKHNLIKEDFYIEASKVKNFPNNVKYLDKVKFYARLIACVEYPNGCNLEDIYFLRKYEKGNAVIL